MIDKNIEKQEEKNFPFSPLIDEKTQRSTAELLMLILQKRGLIKKDTASLQLWVEIFKELPTQDLLAFYSRYV